MAHYNANCLCVHCKHMRPAPRARKDSVCRPIPMSRNVRGNVISGHPLKKDELVGSTAKFMVAGAH